MQTYQWHRQKGQTSGSAHGIVPVRRRSSCYWQSSSLDWAPHLFGVALIAISLSAQPSGVSVDQVHAGGSLIALANIPVRDRPPAGGALYIVGQQTGNLRPGEMITVSREQTVPALLGNQKWVYFSRSADPFPSSGLVLVGKIGTTSNSFGTKR